MLTESTLTTVGLSYEHGLARAEPALPLKALQGGGGAFDFLSGALDAALQTAKSATARVAAIPDTVPDAPDDA